MHKGFRYFRNRFGLSCGSCTGIQLGVSGSFVAAASGELYLYYNDNVWGDNGGSFDVTITGSWGGDYPGEFPTTPTVLASECNGVENDPQNYVTTIQGQTYVYSASITSGYDVFYDVDANYAPLHYSDADGYYWTGSAGHTAPSGVAGFGFPAPDLVKRSLVAFIDTGNCGFYDCGCDQTASCPPNGKGCLCVSSIPCGNCQYIDIPSIKEYCTGCKPGKSFSVPCSAVCSALKTMAINTANEPHIYITVNNGDKCLNIDLSTPPNDFAYDSKTFHFVDGNQGGGSSGDSYRRIWRLT